MVNDTTPAVYGWDEIREGMSFSRAYELTPDVLDSFVGAFADVNPLHMDADYARARGFKGRVVHGAVLNGFLSHFVGMVFPGKGAMLASSNVRYVGPSYAGETVELQAVVQHKSEAGRSLELNVTFHNVTQNKTVARAAVQVVMLKEPA